MNVLLVFGLLAVIYLLLDAGYVFFALVVGVALFIMLVAGLFSGRPAGKPDAGKPAPQPTPAEEPLGPYATKGYTAWERVFMAAGAAFNLVGKTIYRAFFKPAQEKHYHGKIKIKTSEGDREEKIKIKFKQDDD